MNPAYLVYHQINKKKWDACIRDSSNGLIYAESIYLDHMAENWDAIILGDYEAVMPLTWKKKWGIPYLYQPPFIQQGGIFSSKQLPEKMIPAFIEAAAGKFRFAEITLNYANEPGHGIKQQVKWRNNFILPLGAGYQHIQQQYSSYINQRLNRLVKFSLKYERSADISAVIKLYKKLYSERMPTVQKKDFVHFEELCKLFYSQNRVIIRQVYNSDGMELLAAILLLRDQKRLYNIISCILPNGKKLLANYFLYNEVIKEFAHENILLDFEGSDLPGIAYFYNKFASGNQQYPFVKFNRLPLPVKLLKR